MPNLTSFSCLLLYTISTSCLHAEDKKHTATLTLDPLLINASKPPADFPINAPLNLTTFDQDLIKELGLTRVQDIAQYVPNYNLIDAGANGYVDRSSIRGLTNTPIFTTPSIILYVDDIPYLSTFSYTNQLVGVDSIEVMQGPQGGLFGKNSYAGVINIKSRKPSHQTHADISIEKGNFDSLKINAYISAELIKNKLFYSLGGIYFKRQGYIKNTFLDITADNQNHLNGQASILWTPDSNWEVNFKATLQDFNDDSARGVSLSSDDIYKTQSGEKDNLDQDANSQAIKISYQNSKFEILSITARRESKTDFMADFDFLPQPLLIQHGRFRQKQWSQEFRLKSIEESSWRWSLGLFFSKNTVSSNQTNLFFQLTDNLDLKNLDETAYAAFGQISYQGFESLRLFVDLRLDSFEKEIDRNLLIFTGQTTQLKDKKHNVFVSPKLTLDYTLSTDMSAYFSTGVAFKPGGFSAQSNDFPEYSKETLWHNEIGIKSTWLNQRVTANLALFYNDIKNYQQEEAFTPFDYTVVNAPKVNSYGSELNLEANIIDTFEVSASIAYTEIQFQQYIDPFTGEDLQGKRVPYVPKFNLNLSAKYQHPLGVFARTDYIWVGKTYFDATNSDTFSEQDYFLVNALLGYEYKKFNISAYIKNLTQSEYFTYKIPRLNLGASGEPRTFGANISFKF